MTTSSLFPGPLGEMPASTSFSVAMFRPATETPSPVRFVVGFDPFVDFARDCGANPTTLASDVSALWEFLGAHPFVLSSWELKEAAARFAGNVVAVTHPAATWRVTDEPEIGTSSRSIPVGALVQTMVHHPEQRTPFLEMFSAWDQEDLDDAEIQHLAHDNTVPSLSIPARTFQRPVLPSPEFRDETGHVIHYGSRWSGQSPPDEAYSRETHSERFKPLSDIVQALVTYLEANYAVTAQHEILEGAAPTTHLRPADGAQITLTLTEHGVHLTAGRFFQESVPSCSCDACDEKLETAADRLENVVLSIAAGGLRERYPLGSRRWFHTQLHTLDGNESSHSTEPDEETHFLAESIARPATETLATLDNGWWPSWPLLHPAQESCTGCEPSDPYTSGREL